MELDIINQTDTATGSRWTIEGYRNYLRSHFSVNDSMIWKNVQEIIAKAMIAAENTIVPELNRVSRGACFQLMGTDIDLDSNFRPWLIESNVNPTINSKIQFERDDKFEMLRSLFKMVQITESEEKLANERQEIKQRKVKLKV